MQHSQLLTTALEAVKAAEEVILHYFNTTLTVDVKGDTSPVTIADRESEKIIRNVISGAFPDHGFLGEEFGIENNSTDYHWVIDPIDGTKEFLRGMPFFSTQLALMKNSEFIVGVSNAPLLKETTYAEKGGGAFLNDQPINVSGIAELSEAYIVTGGVKYFARNNTLGAMISLVEKVRGNRIYGSLLGYSYVANGKAEVMIEVDTKLWDVAAFTTIIQEAGGTVTTPAGDPLPFADTISIVASNGLIHDQVLAHFNT